MLCDPLLKIVIPPPQKKRFYIMDQCRIGIACNRLASGGGMESHALSIITELANQGFTPVIFTKNHKELNQLKNFEIISCSTKMIPRILEDWYFSKWLRNNLKSANIKSCIGFCRNTESDILFCGGTHRGFTPHRSRHRIYDSFTTYFEDLAFRNAKFILPASQLIAQELQSLYGINKNKLVTAYPPIPTGKFRCFPNHKRLQARTDLGLSPDKTVLLFPSASGHQRKGLPFIVESLKGLTNFELAVAGKPNKIECPSIISLGYQTDMEKVYNAADYTILASNYEPFGLVGVESVLCGTPVILAKNIGCTEVLSGSACITFNLEDRNSLKKIFQSLLPPKHRTSAVDINYNFSARDQALSIIKLVCSL